MSLFFPAAGGIGALLTMPLALRDDTEHSEPKPRGALLVLPAAVFPLAGYYLLFNGYTGALLITAAAALGWAIATGHLVRSPTPERSAWRLAFWSAVVAVEVVLYMSVIGIPLVLGLWVFVVHAVWKRWQI